MASLSEQVANLTFVSTEELWKDEARRVGLYWDDVLAASEALGRTIDGDFLQDLLDGRVQLQVPLVIHKDGQGETKEPLHTTRHVVGSSNTSNVPRGSNTGLGGQKKDDGTTKTTRHENG